MNNTSKYFTDWKTPLRIKVCGMRDPENMAAIAKLPVDLMGFIFYEKSPRFVGAGKDVELLKKELAELNSILRVGVFVNAKIPVVLEKAGAFHLDYIQLHGDEQPEYCQSLKKSWPELKIIKAFAVDEDFDFNKTKNYESFCDLFLFDAKGKNYGGNSSSFDWQLLKKYDGKRLFLLSGGIDLDSAETIKKLNFRMMVGVDLNSRFEIEPGLKDVQKIRHFAKRIKN